MNSFLSLAGIGVLLMLLQVLAALPWLAVVTWSELRRGLVLGGAFVSPLFLLVAPFLWLILLFRDELRRSRGQLPITGLIGLALALVAGLLLLGGVLGGVLALFSDADTLFVAGRIYSAVLHLQLVVDLFVLVFALLHLVWPKGGAVALAAFREGIRQPLFLGLALAGLTLLTVAPFIPYFTFGEDFKMVEELGYDTIMFVCILFGTLAASISVSDEIEGRTAITLMSKPVSRRQFLLGKFVGIFLAGLVLTSMLGWYFDWMLLFKRWFDRMDPVELPTPLTGLFASGSLSAEAVNLLHGVEAWLYEGGGTLPGLVLGACQAMVLIALAVSLATRLPMAANLVVCLVIYFLGHLTPVLVQIAQHKYLADTSGLPVTRMLYFMAQLFDALLPGLDFFSLGPAVVREDPLPTWPFALYVASVSLYGLLYTVIVLVFGLVLFEDRDLA